MNKEQKEVIQEQLDREKELLKDLKLVYGQAQDDTVNKVIDLSRRKDMENLQTIIFQSQYQDVLRTQIDAALDKLQNESYNTIQEYLEDCYTNGFVGAFYDIAGQGIPLVVPIDHEAVVKAIQIDSKLSTKKVHKDAEGKNVALYEKMGENIDDLKQTIRMEVSRGVLNGSSWNDIGKEIADSMKSTTKGFGFNKALNNATRIARTEGHRIQVQSALDAQKEAKKKGADVLKQWDATLDGATRDTHRELDGKIAEVDEDFTYSGGSVSAPGMFGDPGEDCNCRCALLQRASWALDESELETLKERAEYFGLDKTKDFEDYKEKFLKASDQESVNVQKSSESTSQEKAQDIDFMSNSFRPKFGQERTVEYDGIDIPLKPITNSNHNLLAEANASSRNMAIKYNEKMLTELKKELPNGYDMPPVAVIDFNRPGFDNTAIAGYDKTTNILYWNMEFDSEKKVTDFLTKIDGWFASTDVLSPYKHELGHKYYYDCINNLAKNSNISYNESREEINRRIQDYFLEKTKNNKTYVYYDIGGKAAVEFIDNNYSEVIAECNTVKDVSESAKGVLGIIKR